MASKTRRTSKRGGAPARAGCIPATASSPPGSGGEVVRAPPNVRNPNLRELGGSESYIFNTVLLNQAAKTLWLKHSDDEARDKQIQATLAALAGIGPRDEIEGMLAAQMVGLHNAQMECLRRAMLPDQMFEGWREQLNQANKLSRSFAALVEALNRHRGKGQQRVTVEHVHVH